MTLKTTGFNASTAQNLLLDAGAIYKDFDTAAMEGTLIGATQGGNAFSAVPDMRPIPIDGVKSDYVVGLTVIDGWEVSLTANLLEVTKDSLEIALGATKAGNTTATGYDSVVGKNELEDTDYEDNIAFVGKLSGNAKPIIIVVHNALNRGGLNLDVADKSEGVLPVTFHGHVTVNDMDQPPFEIFYPTSV